MTDQPRRPSGLPYPAVPPTRREDLTDVRGAPGAPASWGLRALARIIDFVVVSLPFSFITFSAGVRQVQRGPRAGEWTGPLWTLLLFPLALMVYEAVLVSRSGQTLGKWMCMVKVVDWQTGDLPPLSQATTRAVVPGVLLLAGSAAPLVGVPALGYLQYGPLVVYLTSLVDPLYRGVHDKAAGTIVLSAPRALRRPPRSGSADGDVPPAPR